MAGMNTAASPIITDMKVENHSKRIRNDEGVLECMNSTMRSVRKSITNIAQVCIQHIASNENMSRNEESSELSGSVWPCYLLSLRPVPTNLIASLPLQLVTAARVVNIRIANK